MNAFPRVSLMLIALLLVACGHATQTIDYEGVAWVVPMSKDSVHSRLRANPDFNFYNISGEGTSLPQPPMLMDSVTLQIINLELPTPDCMDGLSALLVFDENFDQSKTTMQLASLSVRCAPESRDQIAPKAYRKLFEREVIHYIQHPN